MHNFKKVACSAVATVLVFVLISSLVITPYLNSETAYYQDNRLRSDLAGTIDCIVLGSSQGLAAIDPRVLDAELGCCSYNLSTISMTLDNKYSILEKEIQRNPADTVILEISFDTLARIEMEEFAQGDEIAITRLDTMMERLTYLVKYVKFDTWLDMYSRLFVSGMSYCMNALLGNASSDIDVEAKGFLHRDSVDLTLSEEQILERRDAQKAAADYPEENVEKFSRLIELCKSHGSRVIVVTVPVSDAKIWSRYGWDEIRDWISAYCAVQDCEFYDLNLLVDRYSLFNDRVSFYDEGHMSGVGAAACTEALCNIINRVDAGEDISALFYDSYAQMKQDSPYAIP